MWPYGYRPLFPHRSYGPPPPPSSSRRRESRPSMTPEQFNEVAQLEALYARKSYNKTPGPKRFQTLRRVGLLVACFVVASGVIIQLLSYL